MSKGCSSQREQIYLWKTQRRSSPRKSNLYSPPRARSFTKEIGSQLHFPRSSSFGSVADLLVSLTALFLLRPTLHRFDLTRSSGLCFGLRFTLNIAMLVNRMSALHHSITSRGTRMRTFCRFGAVLAVFFAFVTFSFAQTGTTSVGGTVVDSSGAAIAGATVTISNTGQALEREVQTNSAGEYRFLALPPGTYTLTVEKQGFRKFQQTGLAAGANARILRGVPAARLKPCPDTVVSPGRIQDPFLS